MVLASQSIKTFQKKLSFEAAPSKNQGLEFMHLSSDLMEKKGLTKVDADIFKVLDLLSPDGIYNNAAAVFADENNFPGIDMARFGKNINEFFHRETHDNVSLLKLYEHAIALFKFYYEVETVQGMSRVKTCLIPEEAFRETLVNALAHRDWELYAHIRISFYEDKIQITSPGCLPKGVSESEYLEGRISVLRNPIICSVLFHLGCREKFGTGVLRIKDAYKDSLVKPTFEFDPNSLTVTLPTLSSAVSLTDDERRVLQLVKDKHEATRQNVESFLSCNTNKASRILRSLTDKGLLKKVGAARSTKYVL